MKRNIEGRILDHDTIETIWDIVGLVKSVENIAKKERFVQKYFDSQVSKNSNQYTLYARLFPDNQLEIYNCAYEKTMEFRKIPFYKKLQMK